MTNGNGVSKLEYLCDALTEYLGSHDPRSEAYKFRNPLALKEVRAVQGENGKKVIQFGEMRRYRSWVHGYESALYDLRVKCSGRSSCGLTEYSSLNDLTSAYGMPSAENVANYLSYALENRITPQTQLFVFLR